MIRFSQSLLLVTAFALSGAAAANPNMSGYATNRAQCELPPLAGRHVARNSGWQPTAGGPSETAWFFHRRGARLFDKQDFDAAETAFEASLRAQGGSLKENTLLYLAHIAIKNGDAIKAKNYAEAAGIEISGK